MGKNPMELIARLHFDEVPAKEFDQKL